MLKQKNISIEIYIPFFFVNNELIDADEYIIIS